MKPALSEAWHTFDARVVDGDVETTEAGDSAVNDIAHILFTTHVGLDEFRFGAQAAEFGRECLAGILSAAGHDHPVTGFREAQGRGAADTCEGSGDQCDGRGHGYLLGFNVTSRKDIGFSGGKPTDRLFLLHMR
jgi:hypothetical protein